MNIRVLIPILSAFIILLIQGDAIARIADKPQPQSSLVFVENKGQITDQHHNARKDIDFKLNAPGIDIFIGKGQLHYQWAKSKDSISTEIYRLDVSLVGANNNATVTAEDKQGYYENYYLPSTPDGATAYSYKKITCKNIYPNIDWVLYLKSNTLKYDFIVHEGGNANNIKIQYNGATALQVKEGALQVTTPLGSITEHAPYSYKAKTKEKINSSYKLNGNILSVDIENTTDEIVIDPQLDWATYYGGNQKEANPYGEGRFESHCNPIAVDGVGDVYIVGYTQSTGNIATVGAYDVLLDGSSAAQDGFVAKFNGLGILLWGTYYGGSGRDGFSGVVTASDNTVFVAGNTKSTSGIATTGCHQFNIGDTTTNKGDGMLIKFDANGQRIWGTYYGGIEGDGITQIAISSNNDIYITGETSSYTNIATPLAFQTNFGRAFLAKFNSAGVRQWGTYYSYDVFGTTYSDFGLAVVCDKNNDVYFAGITGAPSGIATANSHQSKIGGGSDVFIAKFNAGGQRIWATYYGGTEGDLPLDLDCDDSLNVYLVGLSNSINNISTSGSYMEIKPASTSVLSSFAVKFTKDGIRTWGTYLNGSSCTVLVDAIGDICFSGFSGFAPNIATSGAWQSTAKGGDDGMYIKFDKAGARLWGTYYGSTANDQFLSMAKTPSNDIYFVGYTESFFGMSTPGSHQTSYGGNGDMFLVRSNPDSIVYVDPVDTLICIPPSGSRTMRVYYTLSRSFRPGNIITVQLSDSNGSFANPINIGNAASTISGYVDCTITSAIPFGKRYRIRVVASLPFYTSTDNGKNIEMRQGPEKPEAWGDTSVCAGGMVRLYANCATAGVSYSWTGPAFSSFVQNPVILDVIANGTGNYVVTVSPFVCKMKDTVHVVVKPLPKKPVVVDYAPVCEGSKLTLTHSSDTGSIYYIWYKPSLLADTSDSLTIPVVTKNDAGDYVLVITRAGCTNADTINIVVKRIPVLTASSNSPLRVGSDLYLNADVDSGDATYVWKGPYSYGSNEGHTVRKDIQKNAAGVYTITATVDGCSTSKQLLVVIDDGLKQSEYLEINPNPNRGTFTLSGIVLSDQLIPMEVVNALGQTIYTASTSTIDKRVNVTITLPDVAQGEYFLRIRVSNKNQAYRFIISK